jgi:hypothetical protein
MVGELPDGIAKRGHGKPILLPSAPGDVDRLLIRGHGRRYGRKTISAAVVNEKTNTFNHHLLSATVTALVSK